jgi:outer membrane protein TolC
VTIDRRIASVTSLCFCQVWILEIARHELETAEAVLSSVDDHVKTGLAVESDRMSAQVSLAARKQGMIAAQGDLDLAWAELRVAMGTPDFKASILRPISRRTFPTPTLNRNSEPRPRTAMILPH